MRACSPSADVSVSISKLCYMLSWKDAKECPVPIDWSAIDRLNEIDRKSNFQSILIRLDYLFHFHGQLCNSFLSKHRINLRFKDEICYLIIIGPYDDHEHVFHINERVNGHGCNIHVYFWLFDSIRWYSPRGQYVINNPKASICTKISIWISVSTRHLTYLQQFQIYHISHYSDIKNCRKIF